MGLVPQEATDEDPEMSHLLRSINVCLRLKMLFLWSGYCKIWTFILLITTHIQTECARDCLSHIMHKTHTKPNRQIVGGTV